jgi:hypothetical protein
MADFYKVRTSTGWGVMTRAGDGWVAYINEDASIFDENYINTHFSDCEKIDDGNNPTFQGLPITIRNSQ